MAHFGARCMLKVTMSSTCVIYIPSRLMSSCAVASTAPCAELAWTDLLLSWMLMVGRAISAWLPSPSMSAAVDLRIGAVAQREGHACMLWLVPGRAISGGDGVDGMSGGSHSSQTPCRRQQTA